MAIDQPNARQAEERLAKILASVLYVEPEEIDRRQTLQALGLDSILAVEFITEVRKEFDREIKLDVLYQHPSIGALAEHLTRENGEWASDRQ